MSKSLKEIQELLTDQEKLKKGNIFLNTGELTTITAYLMNADLRRSDRIRELMAESNSKNEELDRMNKVLEEQNEEIKKLKSHIKKLESVKLNTTDIFGDNETEGKFQTLESDCGRNAFRLTELENGAGQNNMKFKELEELKDSVGKEVAEVKKLINDFSASESTIKDTVGREVAEVKKWIDDFSASESAININNINKVLEEQKKRIDDFSTTETAMNKALEEQKNESHKRDFDIEMNLVQNNLIFHNLAVKENEDKAVLKRTVENVFQSMKIGPRVVVKDVIRFKRREEERNGSARRMSWADRVDRPEKPPLVLVKLGSVEMKKIIFTHIRNLKETPYQRISINNQVPKCVVKQVTELEIKARKIRVDSGFKVKTKVELNGGYPKLQVKGENDEKFKDV